MCKKCFEAGSLFNDYLCAMRKQLAIVILQLGSLVSAGAQSSYLDRPDLLALADSCLRHTYGFSFTAARRFQRELENLTPSHPAPPFLEALILYWEHFPLTPEDEASEEFVRLMDTSINRAGEMMNDSLNRKEGVFFDLFGRAFKAMFWADNGKAAKVVPDLRTMYIHAMEGFSLKEEMSEFYFSTGLYNYYIEAYPEAHPVYKPLVSFMQEGDRELGLSQLNYAMQHSVYLRVEATLFMSIIQLKYENDQNTAALYAERLFREYPRNIFYQGHLINILLHQHRYQRTGEVLSLMVHQHDPYTEMIRTHAKAYMTEMSGRSDRQAETEYEAVLEMAGHIGPFADTYMAMAFMGLSRLYEARGLDSESKRFARKAEKYTSYRFILDEKRDDPR
jgi:AcrR family transcriptional regulator